MAKSKIRIAVIGTQVRNRCRDADENRLDIRYCDTESIYASETEDAAEAARIVREAQTADAVIFLETDAPADSREKDRQARIRETIRKVQPATVVISDRV